MALWQFATTYGNLQLLFFELMYQLSTFSGHRGTECNRRGQNSRMLLLFRNVWLLGLQPPKETQVVGLVRQVRSVMGLAAWFSISLFRAALICCPAPMTSLTYFAVCRTARELLERNLGVIAWDGHAAQEWLAHKLTFPIFVAMDRRLNKTTWIDTLNRCMFKHWTTQHQAMAADPAHERVL
jgi:hypothetical protein